MNANDKVLLQVGYFIMSSPELLNKRITDDEDRNKTSIEICLPKPLQVVNQEPIIKLNNTEAMNVSYANHGSSNKAELESNTQSQRPHYSLQEGKNSKRAIIV